ncbi:carbon-nitrogen hydrolase family protein [Rhodococcus aerolatus]
MATVGIAAAAASFGRDLDFCLGRVGALIEHARRDGVGLLVLPDAALGGYLDRLTRDDGPGGADLPPALEPDDPRVRAVAELAREMVVCFGFCELDGGRRYNTALCVTGDGVLGRHRKVHQPPGERHAYSAGDGFAAFDTPVGRLGMLIDYDKTFPESARALAVDGAQVLACLSAWPTSITNRAPRMAQDRQSRLFDLYDQARAAENQLVLASANLTGSQAGLRFLGQAKVVGPGGDVLARTWSKAGLACARVDVTAEIAAAHRVHDHLAERRPETYR